MRRGGCSIFVFISSLVAGFVTLATLWEEGVRGNGVHFLIDFLQKGVTLLDHATLHFAAEILSCPLGYLFDVGFQALGRLR